MSTQINGGPAFPYSGVHKGEKENLIVDSHGMTLRDYFAAKAMQSALLASKQNPESSFETFAQSVAEVAYDVADAMLRAREAS
ncbi:hypothetical protein [Escherichia coli]|uniref:hypothetical protein n=1 Tax=Enterobacteriaceae TaxID=543 RepID=UPI001FF269CC|nr:hypothetical protein [Escherichia coli]MDB7221262.1 hypothetical protein [Escherichia coli]MDB7244482.1 hypothetical protein [Escherichia coli]MDB8032645.1 hypothetical protein [Escherichia coli]